MYSERVLCKRLIQHVQNAIEFYEMFRMIYETLKALLKSESELPDHILKNMDWANASKLEAILFTARACLSKSISYYHNDFLIVF